MDRPDPDIGAIRSLLCRYMRHVIETKGTSLLDRRGLPVDSIALSDIDLAVLKSLEQEVKPTCTFRAQRQRKDPVSSPGDGFMNDPISVAFPTR